MTNPETKHNYFSIKGDIRTKEAMTTKEFLEILDKLGLEFIGTVGYSEISDSDYNSDDDEEEWDFLD